MRRSLRTTDLKLRGLWRRFGNLRFDISAIPHIHVLREREYKRNWTFFNWVEQTHPAAARLFRFTTADDADNTPRGGATLFIPWLQDPVHERAPTLYRKVEKVEMQYRQKGVPVVNPVKVLSNSIKSHALATLRQIGIRTANTLPLTGAMSFEEVADMLGLPFIVRNDLGHGGAVQLVYQASDYDAVAWHKLTQPVAMEFVDTRGLDGLYRKYRYVMVGETGMSRHLVITPQWMAHAADRLTDPQCLAEEIAFFKADNPYHDTFNAARKALQLDFVAFDYSFDAAGQLVIWEPNPFPVLSREEDWHNPNKVYQHHQVSAIYHMLLRYYFTQANLIALSS